MRISVCLLLLALGVEGLTPQVRADCGNCPTTIVPCGISLVGVDARGVPDPRGTFNMVLKDPAGNPRPGILMAVDFSNCPDVSICSAQGDPGVGVICSGGKRMVTGVTDSLGRLSMTIVGGVAHRVPGTLECADIYADGALVTDGTMRPHVSVAAYDESSGDGLTGADFSLFLSDFFGPYESRADFDYSVACSHAVAGSDLSAWLRAFFSSYVQGCNSISGTLCP
jgi:hypothetical protein